MDKREPVDSPLTVTLSERENREIIARRFRENAISFSGSSGGKPFDRKAIYSGARFGDRS